MKRTATAVWTGSIKEGNGNLTTQSSSLDQTQYSYTSRFEEGTGTNPEELIAAAHAGCFAMKLSGVLGEAGFTPDSLEATSAVTIENGAIKSSHITLKARVKDIDEQKFQQCADEAKANCPVSKALNMNISLDAELIK
jgi:osmotically inducible protein OsmC